MQNYPPSEYNNRIIEAIIQRSIQERYIEVSIIIAYLHNLLAKLEKDCCKGILLQIIIKGKPVP